MLTDEIRSGTSTEIQSRTKNQTSLPWTVIVYDDPINLMQYVTMVFKKVFGYSEEKAMILMKQVHEKGRSLVWSGEKEKAEFYVQQLHSFQLKASLEQES
ncbi:MAG: ATP-dependent Clp protease adapter ClpS [Akkermansiaceae bacterium]